MPNGAGRTDVVGLPPGLAGTTVVVSNVWDAIHHPLMGGITHRTRSRWGRRKPWIFAGALLLPPAMAGLWAPIGDWESQSAKVWFVIIAHLLWTTGASIGAVPDAVLAALHHHKHLGIHTEMFGDGILSLVEAGVVTNKCKNEHRGKMLATFALGSDRLYAFMHRNPVLEMHPVDVTNTPHIAGRNDNLHSINSTLAVDLIGQCGSESLGSAPYSGTGGQSDFVRAANISKGGKSFIVLPSTAKSGTVSRIVPTLLAGTQVTTSKNDVGYVVTEFGVAQLRGLSARERARALIEIAHPDFRDELTEGARRVGLLR